MGKVIGSVVCLALGIFFLLACGCCLAILPELHETLFIIACVVLLALGIASCLLSIKLSGESRRLQIISGVILLLISVLCGVYTILAVMQSAEQGEFKSLLTGASSFMVAILFCLFGVKNASGQWKGKMVLAIVALFVAITSIFMREYGAKVGIPCLLVCLYFAWKELSGKKDNKNQEALTK